MEGGTCLSRGKFLTADNAQLYATFASMRMREREKSHFPKLYHRHRLSKRKGKIINYICFNYLERREEQVEVASNFRSIVPNDSMKETRYRNDASFPPERCT